MVGKTSGESYAPPPPIFFDILACPVVNIGHATSSPRSLYYVCVVIDVLEGTLGYGEHVHPPTPPCTSL
jgi:hypothetical protein